MCNRKIRSGSARKMRAKKELDNNIKGNKNT